MLLARRLDLRASLFPFALRDDLLVEQRLDAVELRLCQVERGLGVHHFRHMFGVERLPGREPEARLDLPGVRLGFQQLRRSLRGGDPHQHGAGRDARAAFDWRRGDAAGELGADFGLLVGEQRASHAQVPFDGEALHGSGRHHCRLGHRGGSRSAGFQNRTPDVRAASAMSTPAVGRNV